MKTQRKYIIVTVLVAILALLTVSLAFAGNANQGSGNNSAAVDIGAQEVAPSQSGGTMCAGGGGPVGIIHDDGSFENGYSGNPAVVTTFEVYNLFNPVAADYEYSRFCVALVSLAGPDLNFEIVFRADNGGQPGNELAAVSVSAANIPAGLPCGWYEYDLTGEAGLPDGSAGDIWIGVRYSPPTYPSRFTCADESPATPLWPGFVNFNTGNGWQAITAVFPNYRALSTRVEMVQVEQQDPAIEISKTPGTQTITTGGNADFTITVTNTGDVDLANVNVVDPLVADCDNAIGALIISQTVSYACQDVGVAGSYTNVVTVTSQLVTGAPGPSATDSAVVNTEDPTSVSLSGFGNGSTALTPIWVVALLVVAVGFGLVLRRKLTAQTH